MLTTNYKRLLACFSLMCSTAAQAQNLQEKLDSFSGKFITAIKSQDRPQAYLTTDKSIFRPGEAVWFRGFLLNAVSQKVAAKSRYLFVDLVNDKDSVISAQILDAAHQQLDGRILLPSNLDAGYYWLRGYTSQMAVHDTANSCIKSIYVITKNGRPAFKTAALKKQDGANGKMPTIQFYPEGGAIITRVNSTVAFSIQDSDQKPVATEGIIKDDHDAVVAKFAANKFGLGKIVFTPYPARKYTAVINWNGKDFHYALPSFNPYAAQVAVTNKAEGKIALQVLLEDSIYTKDAVTYLIGVSKDSLCFAGIGRGLYALEVPEQKFPGGVATFYLFGKDFKFLSARSVYIKENAMLVNASLDKTVYAKKEKATLNLAVTDAANNPVPALFSVAVVDSAFLNPDDDCAIASDVRALTEKELAKLPCFSDQDLDLLMLARSDMYPGNSKVAAVSTEADDHLFFINGTALDEKGAPARMKVLTLFSNNGNNFFLTDTTDNTGRFSFPLSDYQDSTQFTMEAKDMNGKRVAVRIQRDQISLPHFATPLALKRYLPQTVLTNKYNRAYVDTALGGTNKTLPAVSVKGKREAEYDVSKRVSSSSIIVTSDKLNQQQSVGNAVLNVPGVQLIQGSIVVGGLTSMRPPSAATEPLLLINGVQTAVTGSINAEQSPVLNALNSLNVQDIDFIEVLKNTEAANYGLRGTNGVILVNMLTNRRVVTKEGSGNMYTFYAQGIAAPALFPAVNYNMAKPTENFDNRSTIFWDGAVLNGAANNRFTFFTTDIPATYKVVITGITAHGGSIYKTLTFRSR